MFCTAERECELPPAWTNSKEDIFGVTKVVLEGLDPYLEYCYQATVRLIFVSRKSPVVEAY